MSTPPLLSTNTPAPLPLRERLKADLKTALKARQTHLITILRSTLAEIDNAEAITLDATMVAVVGRMNDRPRKTLTEAQIRGIVHAEADALQVSRAEYQRIGKKEEAAQLQAEWEVLACYLTD